ncbi:FtsW/RodA/SpoVE family cell cycle protein [Desulforamulus aeronauticus]|uniref:Cell division protein FtsW, lipid II flippase n=1 Tax=Desulforamulus aeronauticus DSM 10349 TaxID=1121421 RepID=A0A1M6S5B5_9FIRM|nr:FtsW/RodA/SpoVE family cell cycle protein [Desulforamulus aeronauticus]SHK39849.1 cell division protein FtsW, lipid II flippase [Desulforamulus aeronauticus DSM 10349]
MSIERNQQVQEYLNHVCSHIKWVEVHEQVKQELLSHIEDRVAEYSAEGISEQEAIELAINRMGDSVVLGKQLHKAHKPPTNWKLLSIVAILAGMGLCTLYSVEMQGLLTKKLSVSIFTNSVIYVFFGLAVLLGITYFDYRKLKNFGWQLFSGTMFIWLMLLMSPMLGSTTNVKPYLNLGFINIDYIGATPFLLTVALASIFFNKDWSKPNWFVSTIFLLIVPNIFYFMSPSFTGVIIYTAVFLILLSLAGVSKKQLTAIAILPMGFSIFSLVQEPYLLDRLLTFMNPYHNPLGSGYIYIQSIEAIRSAGLWGQGFTFSGNLPEFHTDLIFSYIVYTFGWVAGAVVIILAVALTAIMIDLVKRVKDKFGRLLVTGLTSILGLHFLWNILMAVGLAPISGISLPFFSYGGTQTVINMAIIGLVLSVYRRKNVLVNPIKIRKTNEEEQLLL